MIDENIIKRKKLPVHYPEEINITYYCAWRALYNVVLKEKQFSLVYNQFQRRLTEPEIREVFDQFNKKIGGRIFHLKGHHWVSLTKEYYTDDAYRYEVNNYEEAVQELSKWENI